MTDEKEKIKNLISEIIFNGYGTSVIEKYDRRWKFKTLNAEEHQRLFTIATLDEDDEVNWCQYKMEMLKMALVAINDIPVTQKEVDEVVDKLPIGVINILYEEYKKIDDVQVTALSDITNIDDIVKNSSYSKIRYKVMSKLGLLPTEKRVQDLNEYQWMWLYQNIVEEEKEKEESMKMRMDYLAFYINPELSQRIREQEKNNKMHKDGIVRTKAHEEVNPYNPNEVIQYGDTTVDEDFDTKLAMFMAEGEQVTDLGTENSKGNANETQEDFIARVMNNQEFVKQHNEQFGKENTSQDDDGLDIIEW